MNETSIERSISSEIYATLTTTVAAEIREETGQGTLVAKALRTRYKQ